MNRLSQGSVRLFGKIYISIFAPLSLLPLLVSQGFVYSSLLLSAALLHEISHIFFLCRFGAEIKRITIFPFGADISADTSRISYKKELICTLAGCMSNFVFALFGVLLICRFPSSPLLFFVLCNLFLGCLNLIPLSFFDGGKALRLILYDCLDIDRAYYIYKSLDIVSSVIFLFFSLVLISGSGFNFSVICVVIYAAISTLAAPKKQKAP